jgi:menaquinone-dependent protoporphyrinogen IX oxidase
MKTIVVYTSKTGYTKTYAEWIAKALNADLRESKRASLDLIASYDRVVYGGGVHASGINGLKRITKNLDKLNAKKIAVFAVGAAPGRTDELKSIQERNFSPTQRERIGFFYLRGGFDYNKLGRVDKILMTLMKWMLQRKKEKSADERGMLEAYERPIDFTREKNTEQLVAYMRSER